MTDTGQNTQKDKITVRRARDERITERTHSCSRRCHSRNTRATRRPNSWHTATKTGTTSQASSERPLDRSPGARSPLRRHAPYRSMPRADHWINRPGSPTCLSSVRANRSGRERWLRRLPHRLIPPGQLQRVPVTGDAVPTPTWTASHPVQAGGEVFDGGALAATRVSDRTCGREIAERVLATRPSLLVTSPMGLERAQNPKSGLCLEVGLREFPAWTV